MSRVINTRTCVIDILVACRPQRWHWRTTIAEFIQEGHSESVLNLKCSTQVDWEHSECSNIPKEDSENISKCSFATWDLSQTFKNTFQNVQVEHSKNENIQKHISECSTFQKENQENISKCSLAKTRNQDRYPSGEDRLILVIWLRFS
jgi:hypothetical protein